MTDDDLLAALKTELDDLAPMELVLEPGSAFALAGVIQLATRHPDLPIGPRATADRFLAGVRAYFANCPAALEILRRGDDPAQDRPAYVCPVCGARSYNPNDIRERYCGRCHSFEDFQP